MHLEPLLLLLRLELCGILTFICEMFLYFKCNFLQYRVNVITIGHQGILTTAGTLLFDAQPCILLYYTSHVNSDIVHSWSWVHFLKPSPTQPNSKIETIAVMHSIA